MSRKNKPTKKKAREDGSLLIKRAEKRLATALGKADAAREKVSRRERDLAELMARYRPEPSQSSAAEEAIPLAAPLIENSSNGVDDADIELSAVPPSDDQDEQAESTTYRASASPQTRY
jgi:hypothetical protein